MPANLPAPGWKALRLSGSLITVVIPLAFVIGQVITAISAIGLLFTALDLYWLVQVVMVMAVIAAIVADTGGRSPHWSHYFLHGKTIG